VAIKDPAAATFHRQSGANLLLVGQQEQMALGVMANCTISLAAELAETARFHILDGQRAESPTAGFWQRLAQQLPLDIAVTTPGDATQVIRQLAEEVDRRLEANDETAAPIFLQIYNLARFRDLRKSEDFSFSMDEEESASPDKMLATILREGPNLGVHTSIWCDTFTNVNRWLDRQAMNDLGYRVLFQMSATDSANLMESPEASRLGVHRAILYNEEHGEHERFRPYGPPDTEWLAWVRQQLEQRNL
jgi:hypothetical protein